MKKYYTSLTCALIVIFGMLNTTRLIAQCTNTSSFGSATAPTGSSAVTISTCSFQSEYSTINSVVAGNRYVVTASIAGTYITMHFSTPSGAVVAAGVTPLQFTAPCAGTYYAHWNTNSSCGAASSCMTTTIACSSCGAAASQCTMTSSFGSAVAPTSGTTTISTCSFQSEYSTITSVVAARVYRMTASIANTFITIRQGTSSGPVIASGRTPLIWTSTVAGTYYSHWNTNNSCGTASSCMTTTIGFVGSSPCSGSSGCTFSSSFGSATIPANNNVVTISTCSFAGEYSTINAAVSGTTLRFTSSVATDFITIHSGTSNGPVIASGVTPLQFANTFTGTLYAHWALNSSCGSQSSCRTTTVQCVSCSAPAPANDLICNATNISCGQTLAGTTVSSTTTSETTLPFCTTTGGTAGGVWYRLTGFTAGQNITASLCGSGYDTKVHVYSSSTGTCSGTLSCVAGNDDFCGLQSQVSFVATAVPGLTYFIYVHGFSSNTGTFSLNVTCANPTQPNDICTGATPVACGSSVSGNTSLGTPDANACGGPSSPGLWHTITPAVASNITLSLCTGTTYDSRLSVYTGPCASLALVSGGCNDDFCGLQSQLTFTASAGVTYYILVNGFTTGSGPYTLTATCTPITPPPANDNCAGATPVSCGGSVSGNTTFATDDAGFPACPGTGNNFKGVWHTITLPTSGTVTLSLCGGSLWDSYLRLFSGTCGALTCIASDDDGCGGVGLSTLTTAPLAAGTYHILVAGFSSTAFGPYTLSATCNLCAAPPNGGTVTGPVSGCTGSQLAYSTTGASGSLQWQVSTTSASGPFTNVSGATTSSLTYVPATSGNYYFQVSASGAGCTAGTSNVFTTSVLSSGGILTTTATPSPTACPGTTINLNGNFSTGTGSLTITISSGGFLDEVEWTVTGGFSGGPYGPGTTNTVTITPSSYPVTFSINSQGSFNDNTPTYTVFCNATSTVLVTGTLSGGSSFTSGPLNCIGSSGTLTNPSWTGPGGFTVNTLVATLPVTPTSGGAYTLSGLSPTGCPVSSTVTVNVSPAPQALASSNAPVCNGVSLTFFGNNNASGQSTGNSWLWSGPSFSSASQNPSISGATTSNSGTYTLTVTNSFGCTQSSTHTVVVNPNPVLSVASSTNATCPGLMNGCIDFDAGNGTPLYLYDLNGNSTLDGIYCGLAAGSYTASVIDDNGCEATSLTVTITDLDLIPPVITIPAFDRVVQCNGAGNTNDFNDWLITNQGDADASDNCTPVAQLDNSWVNTYNVGNWVTDCGTTKHINVGFAVYDQSGNYSDTTYSTFYILDTLPPVITFTPPSVSVNTDAGLCTSNAAIGTALASDDCAGAGMMLTNDAPALFPVGNTLVTWTATDQCGNSSSSTQTVTVTDNENPVPNCSAAQTQTNDAGDCGANIIVLAPAPSDNCGILSAVNNYNSTADASGHYDVGTTTVTWTVIDIHGNSSTCAQNITVTDNENPVPNCAAAQTQTNDAGDCGANIIVLAPAPSDNCGILSAVNNYNSTADASGHYDVGTTTVTWTVIDIHGNSSTCAQNITVTDNENPVPNCAVAQTQTNDAGDCGANIIVLAPAPSDNCGILSAVNNYNSTADASGHYAVGTTTVTWTVIDIHGNSSTCAQNITVTDNEAPTISCPVAYVTNNDPATCGAVLGSIGSPLTGDNCGVATIVNDHPSAFYPVGTTVVAWTVTDLHGNSSGCVQNVTIIDNEAPDITCPPDVIVNNDPGFCYATAASLGIPVAGDNCGISGVTNNAPAQFPVGATIVDWEVEDLSGNKSQCQQFVIVLDNENPVINGMPADITFTANPADCFPSISWTSPTAADNCSISSFTSNYNPGDEFPEGTTTVIYTAIDINGNSVTASFNITINTVPLVVVASANAYQCGYNISCNGGNNGQASAAVTGGCLPYNYAWSNGNSTANLSGLTAGIYTVTVTDDNGHVTVQSVTLTQPPVLVTTLGPDQSYEFACTCANLVPATTGGSTCQPYSYAWSTGVFTSTITVCPTQTASYTVTVTDINGCIATDVISVIKPALVAQLDRYVVLGTGTQNDNIGSNTVFNSGAAGHRLATGSITLSNNGNINTWIAGNNVIIGNNSTVATLYRNTGSIGNNAVIGTTITPVTIPLTSKVPCFPTFSGGANVNVPGGTTVTISPGTYNNITTGNNSILRMNAGVYNVNSITTGNGSSILPNGAGVTAKDVIVFVKTTMNTGNQPNIHGNFYSQGAMNLGNGNNTSGIFQGAFFGKPVTTGNNLNFHLDSYCYSTLALCNVKLIGEDASEIASGVFNLYPNPNNGMFTIQYGGETGNDISISVLNTLGQVVYERNVYEFTGELIQEVDMGNLNPGVYFIQVRNGSEMSSKQFVVTH